ncbi:class II aldolase/adducin family protein [Nocardia sp. Marseille-Q1738]
MTTDQIRAALMTGGRALAAHGLVTAFGHLSCRSGAGRMLITPPLPLGYLDPADLFTELAIDATELPAGAPKEAWLHMVIARERPDVTAICRAQPPIATALTAAGHRIEPVHGQGALLGPSVPVIDDALLVRDVQRGDQVAQRLGEGRAAVLRGNGAVTVGGSVGEAVALMWLLEASAALNQAALAVGERRPLSQQEQAAWLAAGPELSARIWAWLQRSSS